MMKELNILSIACIYQEFFGTLQESCASCQQWYLIDLHYKNTIYTTSSIEII